MVAYERALHANQNSVPAMNAISLILRSREEFPKAVEYLQAILKIDERNGEVWGSLGTFCPTMPRKKTLALTISHKRPFLSDDGRSAASLCRLPECACELAQPQGMSISPIYIAEYAH